VVLLCACLIGCHAADTHKTAETPPMQDGGTPPIDPLPPPSGRLSFVDASQVSGVRATASAIPWFFDITMEDFDNDG
jgi:hypothetical protein